MYILYGALIIFDILLAGAASGHALLYKRDPRAALGWIAVSLIFPFIGPLLYFLFGINRVKMRARKLDPRLTLRMEMDSKASGKKAAVAILLIPPQFRDIVRLSDRVTRQTLVGGNRIEMLNNGEQVYPAMIETIDRTKHSLFLTTYIFETNRTGKQFINSLAQAAKRGVDVRVMLDGIGELYSLPRAGNILQKLGVRVTRFLPPKLIPPTLNINLRNHRKILISDGQIGFTGGMNIGDRHLAENYNNLSRVIDTHFLLTGPIVKQIEETFIEDWFFSSGEQISPSKTPSLYSGHSICRAIAEGPNEDPEKLATILTGAVSSARWRVFIMTPYFLPSRELIAAIKIAALRGVKVAVVLPSKSNLPFVQWATENLLWELLQRGVEVYYQPPPFVHTKLFIIDDYYAHIGSANIDPRSLRLNFELNIEIYDKSFTEILADQVQKSIRRSRRISLEMVDKRPLLVRTRDAVAWLFSPYL